MTTVTTDLTGHNIVIAGAAGGIGGAAARHLATLGARVGCLDLNLDGCKAVVDDVTQHGGRAGAWELDVRDESSVRSAVEAAAAEFGQVHGLVNCVGITGQTNIRSHEVPVDDFDQVTQINLRGAFLLSRSMLPHMLRHDYGRIVQVASISGKEGNAGMVSYSTTKAAMIGMVKAQGKEYADTGITINALAPAVIMTELVEAMPPAQVEYMTDKIPMGRCGTLDEAAALIAWMVSPACSFTTGFTFDLSGGRAVY